MGTISISENALLDEIYRCPSLPGEFWECGVYKGDSAILMAQAIKETGVRPLRLFDTFKGFPPAERGECKTEGDMKCSLREVRERFKEFRFVSYHKGEVPFTFGKLKWAPIAFAHIDLMLGKPTEGAIKRIWPQLVIGGSMIFEDWRNIKCPGVTRAIESVFLPWQIEETGPTQCKVTKQ